LHDSRQEYQRAAQAVAFGEVRVGDEIFEMRYFQEVSDQRDALEIRIGENVGGGEIFVVGLVFEAGVDEFAFDGESGAGAANGLAGSDAGVDGGFDGSVLPTAKVVGLVAAGDEDALVVGRQDTVHLRADSVSCVDGIMLNEHHNAPFCMQARTNMFGAILAAVTKRAKIVFLGNPLPLSDNPVQLAEEIAMIAVVASGSRKSGSVNNVTKFCKVR